MIKRYLEITRNELKHLLRSKFKVISLILFSSATIFSLNNGYELYKKHTSEIKIIDEDVKSFISSKVKQYEQIESKEIKIPRRDPTSPYWAVRNTSTYAFKHPSPLMVFSVGQTEQFGYYKKIKNWSTVYDSDLAEEIANPERLAIGTLDFGFVFIFLMPILLIILLFNVGGLEKDLGFDNLIYLNNISKKKWLFFRFLFYYALILILVYSLMAPYALISGSITVSTTSLLELYLIILVYTFLWLLIFYIVNIFGGGSSDLAIKMISIWLALCIVIPGTVHQISSIKYPLNYMTDYIDTNRDESDKVFDLDHTLLKEELLKNFPYLKDTVYGSDTTINKSIINRSLSGLINILNKDVSKNIESINEQKNNFIKTFNLINPITFFQNKINSITKTDYYSFKEYRKQIQGKIDTQINVIIEDSWNGIRVDKEKYLKYVKKFK